MSKPKYSPEFKIEVAKVYLNGEGSYNSLAEKYGIGHKSVETWVVRFRAQGEVGFINGSGNKRYTSYFKRQCVLKDNFRKEI